MYIRVWLKQPDPYIVCTLYSEWLHIVQCTHTHTHTHTHTAQCTTVRCYQIQCYLPAMLQTGGGARQPQTATAAGTRVSWSICLVVMVLVARTCTCTRTCIVCMYVFTCLYGTCTYRQLKSDDGQAPSPENNKKILMTKVHFMLELHNIMLHMYCTCTVHV